MLLCQPDQFRGIADRGHLQILDHRFVQPAEQVDVGDVERFGQLRGMQ